MIAATLDQSVLELLRWLWAAPPSSDPVIEARARELLLDTIGCAISGTAEKEVAALFQHAEPGPVGFPGVPQASSTSGSRMPSPPPHDPAASTRQVPRLCQPGDRNEHAELIATRLLEGALTAPLRL